jgi:3-isopropylmalate dehydrogenase
MMLKYSFQMEEASTLVESGVKKVLDRGFRTADIAMNGGNEKIVGTGEMGDLISMEIKGS